MNMLARRIPYELQTAMKAEEAIDLGWARNFTIFGDRSRWEYPGWDLIQKHIPPNEVVRALNAYNEHFNTTCPEEATNRRPILVSTTWDELKSALDGKAYPIIDEIFLSLANSTRKIVYITNVGFSDSDGVFWDITVYCYRPGSHEPEITQV